MYSNAVLTNITETMTSASKELQQKLQTKQHEFVAGKVKGMLELCESLPCNNAKLMCFEEMRKHMNSIARQLELEREAWA